MLGAMACPLIMHKAGNLTPARLSRQAISTGCLSGALRQRQGIICSATRPKIGYIQDLTAWDVKMNNQLPQRLLLVLLALLFCQWLLAWYWVPVDAAQGEAYRIIYLHVPAAFAAFLSAGVLLVASIMALRSKGEHWLQLSRASTEVGLIFTILTLATGSIWGKPIWGTWWTWDARLTTTFLLSLMYGGWLLLYGAIPQGPSRTRSCSILGLMIAADVPIIYKSVTWWRTLHQPQTILRSGGSTMDPDMLKVLLAGIFIMAATSLCMIFSRRETLLLEQELEERSLGGMS